MGPVLSADWFWLRKRRRAAGGGCSEAFAAQRHSDPERMRGELLAARVWFPKGCPLWSVFGYFLLIKKVTYSALRRERNKNRMRRDVSEIRSPAQQQTERHPAALRSRKRGRRLNPRPLHAR